MCTYTTHVLLPFLYSITLCTCTFTAVSPLWDPSSSTPALSLDLRDLSSFLISSVTLSCSFWESSQLSFLIFRECRRRSLSKTLSLSPARRRRERVQRSFVPADHGKSESRRLWSCFEDFKAAKGTQKLFPGLPGPAREMNCLLSPSSSPEPVCCGKSGICTQ